MVNAEDRAAIGLLANTLGSERNAVERIRSELASRGWTQAELSRRMEEYSADTTGGVLHPVVLSKLLSGDRGRHVSIDQLVTLAGVFEVPVAEMLLPPSAVADAGVLRALSDGPQLQTSAVVASHAVSSAQEVVARAMVDSDFWRHHVADRLEEAVAEVERQGLKPSDSIRCTFLVGVVDRYNSMKASE